MSAVPSPCVDALRGAARVLVLSGAGMSAECGVPTFRGAGGLWEGFRAEELASPEGFTRDPKRVWDWYRWRLEKVAGALPHAGYHALTRLEERCAVTIVTQNVDGLHGVAGSKDVVELHGSIRRAACTRAACRLGDGDVPSGVDVPVCRCGELLRPAVVWFGEELPVPALDRAVAAAASCEVAIVVGTSSVVYPAAGLPALAREHGALVIEINPDETPLSSHARWSLRGPAGVVLPELVTRAFGD